MKKLPTIALAGAAGLALAGTAHALGTDRHVMNVQLPDGSVAHVEYVGDVAPKVTIEPGRAVSQSEWGPSFVGFDRMMADMDRQTQAMVRQAQEMARQARTVPGAPLVASFGNAPAGASSSETIVSYSNGGSTCTRTTESVSQGPGKPPKVRSSVSGNCATGAAPAPSAVPLNRT